MKPIQVIPNRPARAIRPFLLMSAVACACLVTWGWAQHSKIAIKSAHTAGADKRQNPWRGAAGCVGMVDTHTGMPNATLNIFATSQASCNDSGDFHEGRTEAFTPDVVGESSALQAAVGQLIAAPEAPYAAARKGAPHITQNGIQVARGANIQLTLDSVRQTAAADLLKCATATAPEGLGCPVNPDWAKRHEGAAARMAAIVEIDPATMGVVAMASAHSPCYAAHWLKADPNAMPADCPAMPALAAPQPWRLDNHATSLAVMPGSINKPVLMLALLRTQEGLRYGANWVKDVLKRSSSAKLFDALLCAKQGFASTCAPAAQIAKARDDLGLQGDKLDLFNGSKASYAAPGMQLFVRNTVITVNGQKQTARLDFASTILPLPDADELRDCSSREWEKCRGEDTARLTSELWGQGDALASPMAAAQMAARLAAAANGQRSFAPAHLLHSVEDKPVVRNSSPNRIDKAHAQLIAEGMAGAIQANGTAHAACAAVYGTATCKKLNHISIKTGTPAYTHEDYSAAERAARCDTNAQAMLSTSEPTPQQTVERSRCRMQPYKWVIVMVKQPGHFEKGFTRAVAVLTERNFNKTGLIDSAGDRGVNVSAELALRYLKATGV